VLNSKLPEIMKVDVGIFTETLKMLLTPLSKTYKEEENSTLLKPQEELKKFLSSMKLSESSRLKLVNYKIT